MFDRKPCISINYLVEELIYANIPFQFVSPSHDGADKLVWWSDEDENQVALVSRIVNAAIDRNAQVLIGSVVVHKNETSYLVGFNDSYVDPHPDNVA